MKEKGKISIGGDRMIEKNALIHPERNLRRRKGKRAYFDPNAAITSELMNRAFDEVGAEMLSDSNKKKSGGDAPLYETYH